MIVGTGLLAKALAPYARALGNSCVYAAGVSNSSCIDVREFERERQRLLAAAAATSLDRMFMYFSTCSVDDPEARRSAYVQHKLAMEDLVRKRDRYLIVRLPQLAGNTPNPHTLLNHLFSRIVRSERFAVWRGATRNILDVDDAARVVVDLVTAERVCAESINVANTRNSSIFAIVAAMEAALGRKAIFDTIDRGADFAINIDRTLTALERCGVSFPEDYVPQVIRKYYGDRHASATS